MHKIKILVLFLSFILTGRTAFSANHFNVKAYGATGNGQSIDTEAINKAIDAAAAEGGGTVYFPAGSYLSYSIHLKSNISLYIDQGATLIAAEPSGNTGYDAPEPASNDTYQDFGHSHWHNSLIWGENLENISILGPGTIYGKGLSRGGPYRAPVGNKAIALKLCKNVILRDFTILYGGHFGILATGVDNFTVDNLKMDTNRDGIDVDCCRNVRISNCTINSPWDDAICLKSSFGLGYARATENVTITNCQVSGYDRGSFINGTYQRKEAQLVPDHEGPTGRIKMGTESNGGFKNITISNCVFEYCRGLALETVDGGLLEDITISNISMRDIVNSPIFLRLGGRMRGPEGTPAGKLRRVNINNVVVYNADSHFASLISGMENDLIEDVLLSNIRIYYRQIDSAASKIQQQVPQHEKTYPEPAKFGVLPSYGFFIRHVRNIELNDIQINYLSKEIRPALFVENVKEIRLNNLRARKPENAPLIILKNVSDFSVKNSAGLKDKNISYTAGKSL